MRVAHRIALARPFEVVEGALPRLQLWQRNLKERRFNADQECALDGIGIPAHIHESRRRAIRAADRNNLTVSEMPKNRIKVVRCRLGPVSAQVANLR
jgi:hypothetical protein